MKISPSEKRALLLLIPALLIAGVLKYVVFTDPVPTHAADSDSIAMAEQRAARLRQIVALIPAREAIVKQTSADLAQRESGLLAADTAAQAQASLLEIARRVGKGEQIEMRGADFGAPKIFGEYGLVYLSINFECHIEQLVNFLSDLTHQPELVVPSEERIVSGNPKEKTMSVRMTLAGVVPKKLIPEKKGLGAF